MGRIRVDRDSCCQNHNLHYGSGLPVFRGELRQEGWGLGGLLGGLFRQAVPILKPLAKKLVKTAVRTGGRVLSDVVTGRKPLKRAMKDRFAETIDMALSDEPIKKRKASGGQPKRMRGRRRAARKTASDILGL